MFVIVGLGNPGREYSRTRHNVGFMTIDKIAERLNISVNKKGFRSVYGDCLLYTSDACKTGNVYEQFRMGSGRSFELVQTAA